jgi:hydrogenase-1 operon protein HyaF
MTTPSELTLMRRPPGATASLPSDPGPEYLAMPKGMMTYQAPVLPERDADGITRAGLALLRHLQAQLVREGLGNATEVLDLRGLDPIALAFVDETLGEGEVSVIQTGLDGTRAQETRLAGVWRLHVPATDVSGERNLIEIGMIPEFVRTTAFLGAGERIGPVTEIPEGVMNAPALIAEIEAKVAAWHPGAPTEIINLTLLPMTEQDHLYLDGRLGRGHVSMLSRGYGRCRIVATAIRQVWWVQHFNSEDRLILSTIEITDVPVAALATREDIADSRHRLSEILDALAPEASADRGDTRLSEASSLVP